MTEGWFANLDPDDAEDAAGELDAAAAAAAAIRDGRADGPDDWPALAVRGGFAETEEDYYDRLHAATMAATRTAVRAHERADDQQLIHAVRAMDDADRVANELAERVAEWAGTQYDDAGTGTEGARDVAGRTPEESTEERLVALAERVRDLADEADALRTSVERTAPAVAPNLSALAGPVLAVRLIALAGGLESLAKKPSGTLQVLGAEDALFAHLRGRGSSPKHGVIYTHEYVNGTAPQHRGSAARALAGKLTIAARVDHYSGERKPELDRDLDDRMARIRARTPEEESEPASAGDESEPTNTGEEGEAPGDGGEDA